MRFWLAFALCLLFGTPLQAVEPLRDGAAASYESALRDYRNKRPREAARQLRQILQAEPRHREANLLLGTIYYDQERMRKARTYFDRSDPGGFTPETSFAWGATYLEFGEYQRAIPGFRHAVRSRGPYREFGIYYLGVVYYRLGQWSRSRRFLQSADVQALPVFLRVNRRRYIAAIKRHQEEMVTTIINSNGHQDRDLLVSEPSDDGLRLHDREGGDEDFEATPQKIEAPVWRGSIRPSLALTQQTSALDNHGLAHDSVSVIANREEVQGELTYGANSPRSPLSVQMLLAAGNTSYDANVQKGQYFKLNQATGAFSSIKSGREQEAAGYLNSKLNLGLAFAEQWRVEVGGSGLVQFPDYYGDQLWGQLGVHAGLRFEGESIEMGVEVAGLFPFDDKLNKDAKDLATRVEIEKKIDELRVSLAGYYWETDSPAFISPDRFRFTLIDPSLRYRVGFRNEVGATGAMTLNLGELALQLRAEYFDRQIAGKRFVNRISSLDSLETAVDGGNKFAGSMSYPIWDSFSLMGSVGYNILTAYLYSERDAKGELIKDYLTDLDQMMYQIGVNLSFTDWVHIAASYTRYDNTFIDKAARSLPFRKANPDIIDDSAVYLELSKSF